MALIKTYMCDRCHGSIPSGARYQVRVGRVDGDLETTERFAGTRYEV